MARGMVRAGVLAAPSGVGLSVVSLSRDFIGCVPCIALEPVFGVFLGLKKEEREKQVVADSLDAD